MAQPSVSTEESREAQVLLFVVYFTDSSRRFLGRICEKRGLLIMCKVYYRLVRLSPEEQASKSSLLAQPLLLASAFQTEESVK